MDLSIINEIIGKTSIKPILKDCKQINKKLSLKSVKDTGYATELAYLLYICEMYDEAFKVCSLFDDIEFNGDYTLWGNINRIKLLKSRILLNTGRDEESNKLLAELMVHEHPNLWKNQLRSLSLYDKNINEAVKRNDLSDMLGWQLVKYETMIRFAELPSFPLDKDKLNDDIYRLTIELRAKLKT